MDPNKKLHLSPGFWLSFVIISIAMFGWLVGFAYGDRNIVESIGVTLAKFGAFGGLAMFAWSLLLSGRYKVFDNIFGGQDKVYIAHRFFASIGLALLIIHPLALTIARIPSRGGAEAVQLWLAFDSLAMVLGMIALYGMTAVIIWTLYARVAHETFVRVHRLLGLLFIAGALHAFLAGSVLEANAFMYWYMLLLCGAAALSFIHYSVLADFLHPYYAYKVQSVTKMPGDILNVRLTPRYRHLQFKPGQYVYVWFAGLHEHGFHPFTIASGRRSSELQLYVRMSGDFTRAMGDLKPGEITHVKGPYGGFTFSDKRFSKQLWIAGGIGITPFLSKARSLPRARRWPEIELIYAVKHEGEAFAANELADIEQKTKAFNYTLLNENKYGLKSLHDMLEHFGGLNETAIYVCGPPPMLRAYAKQAEELGLEGQFYYEEFSFK